MAGRIVARRCHDPRRGRPAWPYHAVMGSRDWRIATYVVPAATAVLLLAVAVSAQTSLLRDGDFEDSDHTSPGWSQIAPPGHPATFTFPKEDVHGGRRCGRIDVEAVGGYSSFTQEVQLPRKAEWLRLGASVRVLEADGGSTWLVLTFLGDGDMPLVRSRALAQPGDWEAVVLEAVIPEGAERVLVRCGVRGHARVLFDDVTLVAGSGERPSTDVALIDADSHWKVSAELRVEEPWVEVSVPFPYEAQTPLALRVASEPAGAVLRLSVAEDRENRLLRVHLAPLEAGRDVQLQVQTLLMVRGRDLPGDSGIKLAPASQVPEEFRPCLQPAPGIESDDERIREIARTFSRRDFGSLVQDLFDFLRREIAAGDGDQGALASLERGDAACTGHANLGAALLIAAGVPSRVLACVQVGSSQQEHYLVEAWAKGHGWLRVEPTAKTFPVPDERHAILRVVYPDSPRTAGHVPLAWGGSESLIVAPALDRAEEPNCWQSAQTRVRLVIERDEVTRIETEARRAFEGLRLSAHADQRVRLAAAETPEPIERELAGFLRE